MERGRVRRREEWRRGGSEGRGVERRSGGEKSKKGRVVTRCRWNRVRRKGLSWSKTREGGKKRGVRVENR